MYKYINLISLIGVLVVNGMANALPIAGRTTGEISDLYPSLFTPAGFTFAIWGVIYLFLTLFVLFPFIKKDFSFKTTLQKISPWFVINCLANMAWMFAWHHLIISLSWILMLVLLGSLIMIYRSISSENQNLNSSLFLRIPISIYFGWISVATIANTTTLIMDQGWLSNYESSPIIFIVILFVAFILGIIMLQKYHDTIFTLVLVWAFLGIHSARMSSDFSTESWAKTGLIFSIALSLFIIWKIVRMERLYLKE